MYWTDMKPMIAVALVASWALPQLGMGEEKSGEEKPSKPERRMLQAEDYGQWERLQGQRVSPDGRWAYFTVARVDEDKTLHVLDLQREAVDPEALVVESIERGVRAAFSDDSQWLSVFIEKKDDSKGGPQRGRGPGPGPRGQRPGGGGGGNNADAPGQKLQLRHLEDNEVTEIEQVSMMQFSADSRYAAIEVVGKAEGNQTTKALIVRDLGEGTDTTFGNVVRFAWSDERALLAMVIDSPGISNTVQLFDPHGGRLRTLDSSEEE